MVKKIVQKESKFSNENNSSLTFSKEITFNDSGFESVCFPVYWSYSF